MKPLDPRLLRRARAARTYVVLTAVLGAAAAALVVVQAFAIAHALGPVVTATSAGTTPALGPVWRWVGVLALVAVLRAGVAWAQERFAQRAAPRVVGELREQVVAHAVALGPRPSGRSDTSGAGDPAAVATLATRGLDDLEPYLVRYLPQLLLTALVTPTLVLVVLGLDWVSAVILAGTIPLVPLFMWLVGVMTAGTSERRLRTIERLGAQVLDLLAGLPTLRAFGREVGPGARVRALGDASRRATMGTLRVAFLSGMVLELLTTLSVAIVAVGVGLRLVHGGMELVPAIAVLVLAPEVYLPLRRVGAEFHASTDGLAAAERAFAVLETPLPSRCERTSGPRTGIETGRRSAHTARAVVLDGVTVRAGERGVEAPSGLSARIPLGTGRPGGGRVVALRGPSGAGKSTTALVLLGLLRPDAGRVLLELPSSSVDLADVDPEWWWSQVTWVPQRPSLPPGTLRDVVTDGRDVPDTALVAAARTTGLDDVVAALPDGWSTPVGLGGVGLSVGQRQRVALTAALLSGGDRPLVVLDEPTAHLDARGEQVVLDTVRAWRDAGRTVVVIAHRASLLALADQVVDVDSREVARATA
ncbi:thiol reductant ABC exporter subunit CydD [Isoptericola variabilis]|uniref:ABC transporter, CydDC cysteine exporter (CydDC-E) family, permease/ATP-binding protein CydD n=1 Tax=Isoptericola variabilis (strain 225) TaxID=743718 RepID=F6FQ02_ISOV2|nr:thiol reductant ABC exporter subunit CydD [Isoptericola variabilis]AEG44808.1 ABC transporter, CydDC cysteine exporter (CydDC-E) family, permease/ATP-binding protein CydD [Isoptericola variabilis 225]TWH30695.1 ATP-binding cassette subfamily C protein CydD [Isoptericola variabilis J7]